MMAAIGILVLIVASVAAFNASRYKLARRKAHRAPINGASLGPNGPLEFAIERCCARMFDGRSSRDRALVSQRTTHWA
jgi:hypothetical protein